MSTKIYLAFAICAVMWGCSKGTIESTGTSMDFHGLLIESNYKSSGTFSASSSSFILKNPEQWFEAIKNEDGTFTIQADGNTYEGLHAGDTVLIDESGDIHITRNENGIQNQAR